MQRPMRQTSRTDKGLTGLEWRAQMLWLLSTTRTLDATIKIQWKNIHQRQEVA
jgi:hypothetical protein